MGGTRRRKSSRTVASFFASLFATARRKSAREEDEVAKRVVMFPDIIFRKRLSVYSRKSNSCSGDNELRGCIALIVVFRNIEILCAGSFWWLESRRKNNAFLILQVGRLTFYATTPGGVSISELSIGTKYG